MLTDFVPYLELSPPERQALHAWLLDHRVHPARVPVYATLDWDPAAREWRIPIYWNDDAGRMRLDEAGEDVRKHVVRRRELYPLPWPRREAGDA